MEVPSRHKNLCLPKRVASSGWWCECQSGSSVLPTTRPTSASQQLGHRTTHLDHTRVREGGRKSNNLRWVVDSSELEQQRFDPVASSRVIDHVELVDEHTAQPVELLLKHQTVQDDVGLLDGADHHVGLSRKSRGAAVARLLDRETCAMMRLRATSQHQPADPKVARNRLTVCCTNATYGRTTMALGLIRTVVLPSAATLVMSGVSMRRRYMMMSATASVVGRSHRNCAYPRTCLARSALGTQSSCR